MSELEVLCPDLPEAAKVRTGRNLNLGPSDYEIRMLSQFSSA
jgi:hypothetical protein